jgi:chemotaxis protein MotA
MTWLLGIATLGFLAYKQLETNAILLNAHSLYIVIGGTALVVVLMTPRHVLFDLIKLCISGFREEKKISPKQLISLLKDQNSFKDPHGLVEQAQDLWELGVSQEEFEKLMHYRAEGILNRNLAAIAILRNLGKYPPSLGMIGTVLGMISLFSGLSNENKNNIGGELALAMTATLYGLVLANMIILPLADRLEAIEEVRRSNLESLMKVLIGINVDQPDAISENLINVA